MAYVTHDWLAVAKSAIHTLERPLSDEDVCACVSGNDEGITEAECGCKYRHAAGALEAASRFILADARDETAAERARPGNRRPRP